MPIAPMIDVVFLLLIYFMVSATLQRQEADISFGLPGTVEQADPLDTAIPSWSSLKTIASPSI